MIKDFRINYLKIISWIIALFWLFFLFNFIDNVCVKPNAFIVLINYSESILVVWQVQATITALVIALLALIIGRLEDSYFGLSTKELLFITNKRKIYLNFWETIIISLMIVAFTFLSILNSSLFAAALTALISLIFISYILIQCLYILIMSEKIKIRAKTYINDLVNEVLEYPYKYDNKKYYSLENREETFKIPAKIKKKRESLKGILNKIEYEIKKKILSNSSLTYDETELLFLSIWIGYT